MIYRVDFKIGPITINTRMPSSFQVIETFVVSEFFLITSSIDWKRRSWRVILCFSGNRKKLWDVTPGEKASCLITFVYCFGKKTLSQYGFSGTMHCYDAKSMSCPSTKQQNQIVSTPFLSETLRNTQKVLTVFPKTEKCLFFCVEKLAKDNK